MGLKHIGTKFIGIKKEMQNGHATDDALDAKDANSNEENSREPAEPEL